MKKKAGARDLARICCQALENKKAEELRVLDVADRSSITDYLVIATGTSEPHLRALRIELEDALKAAHTHVVGREATQESGWVVVDAFDVMVHLFSPEQRDRFRLDDLWKDAAEVPLKKLLAAPRRRPAKGKPKRASKRIA
jgi:ribosome-associated protein